MQTKQESAPSEEVKKEDAKKRPTSKDEEEKEWNIQNLDHVLTQITSQHAGIGGIMAAMVYQIDKDAKTKINKKATAIQEEQKQNKKSQSSLSGASASLDKEASKILNEYFDDIFN